MGKGKTGKTNKNDSKNMEKPKKSFISVCRVCLKQSRVESMVSLEEKAGRRSFITYGKVLSRLARISIDYDDILPTKICQNCKQTIENINAFKLMCKHNDRKLQKFVKVADNDPKKYQELVTEYVMYCQFFPKHGVRNTPCVPDTVTLLKDIPVTKTKIEILPPVTKSEGSFRLKTELNENESDNDYSYDAPFDFDNETELRSEYKNVDLFLDSIEKVVTKEDKGMPVKKQDVDSLLDSIEKVMNARLKHSTLKTKQRPPPGPSNCFHCNICNRTLANRNSFNYHMQRHTKYNFICDQCGKGFPGKVPLHRHLVINHDTGPALECKSCPYKCSRAFDLNEHIRIHTGERPFTCEKCGLTFRRRAIWRNHLKQHQEKNITCTICQKKFHRQSDLQWHINSAHVRSYLFICSVCNVSYASNKTVRRHMIAKHGIPRDKQGKITRVTKDTNLSLLQNKSDGSFLGFPGFSNV